MAEFPTINSRDHRKSPRVGQKSVLPSAVSSRLLSTDVVQADEEFRTQVQLPALGSATFKVEVYSAQGYNVISNPDLSLYANQVSFDTRVPDGIDFRLGKPVPMTHRWNDVEESTDSKVVTNYFVRSNESSISDTYILVGKTRAICSGPVTVKVMVL